MMNNKLTGNKGEDLACSYLEKLGCKILERNFRIRGGELDIVAQDHDQIVFIEVKSRFSHAYGLPREAITYWKIKALIKSAMFYLQKRGWLNRSYRIDFIGIDFTQDKDAPEIEIIKNITG